MRRVAFFSTFALILGVVLFLDYRDQHERLAAVVARVDAVDRASGDLMQHMDPAWVQTQRATLRDARAKIAELRDSWLRSEKAALRTRIDNLDERLESHESLLAALHNAVNETGGRGGRPAARSSAGTPSPR